MKWLKRDPGQAKRRGSSFATRAFKSGGYTIAVSLLVLCAVIAANLFVGQIPTTYTKFDTTSQQLFTFSRQTTDILKSLKTDVTLYLVAESGKEDKTTAELLARYKALSGRITVENVDPVVFPDFAREFTSESLGDNDVIVKSGLRSQVIKSSEIYVEDYSDYYYSGTVDTSFDGENALTSAIGYVTSEDLPIVYALSGHGEGELSADLQSAVKKDNMVLRPLSLLSLEAVPEDADCLLIVAPASDIGREESQKILAYLENGGRMVLLTDYGENEMPVLAKLMENYGVAAVKGLVVEGSANNYVPRYPHYLLPSIQSHEITAPLIEGKLYALLPVAHGIKTLDSYRSTLTVTSLLKTSGSAYAKASVTAGSTLEKESGDVSGPFDLGVAITETYNGKETRIVWFSTSKFLDSGANQMVSGANQDLFLNSLGFMCQRESSISIRSKSLMGQRLTVPGGTAGFLGAAIAILLPLAVIGIGIFVYAKRRKR